MQVIHRYLLTVKRSKVVLWCYLIWYLVMACFHFDPSPRLWLTSLGISVVIGIALNLSVNKSDTSEKSNHFQTMRLFLMPLCVSSFSAMVKDQGFILIFSPHWQENLLAILLCLLFFGSVSMVRWCHHIQNRVPTHPL